MLFSILCFLFIHYPAHMTDLNASFSDECASTIASLAHCLQSQHTNNMDLLSALTNSDTDPDPDPDPAPLPPATPITTAAPSGPVPSPQRAPSLSTRRRPSLSLSAAPGTGSVAEMAVREGELRAQLAAALAELDIRHQQQCAAELELSFSQRTAERLQERCSAMEGEVAARTTHSLQSMRECQHKISSLQVGVLAPFLSMQLFYRISPHLPTLNTGFFFKFNSLCFVSK